MAIDRFTPINPYSQITASAYKAKTAKKSDAAEFSNLLMSMFSTSAFGDSSSSEDNNALGSSLNSMMMPLMISLLEKLQSLQVESDVTGVKTEVKNPAAGAELTQDFNPGHHGLDFGVVEGTAIKSTMNGKVIYSGWNDQGYGNLLIVENGSRRTYYAHLSELSLKEGDAVQAGETVGFSGNTGNSTGPHLHYEVRINGQTIDPTEEVFGKNSAIF